MNRLVMCPGCSRHVRADDARCPFCTGSMPSNVVTPTLPTERLGRAALMAFAAAALGSASCSGGHEQGAAQPDPSGGATTTPTAPATQAPVQPIAPTPVSPGPVPTVAAAYGAPPMMAPPGVTATPPPAPVTAPPAPSSPAPSGPLALGPGMAAYGGPPPRDPALTGPGTSDGKVSVPRGSVTLGAVKATGGAIGNAPRVVMGMRAGFRNCYNRTLAANPDATGELLLTVNVGAKGEVSNATSSAKGAIPDPLARCVEARAQAAQFDAPAANPATLVFPITFTKE